MLAGFIGAGLSKTVFGLGRSPQIWIPAQFCSSLNFPLLGSSENALWMAEKQGRVFAANSLVLQGVSAIAALIAGPLANQLLEPAMMSFTSTAKIFGGILGTEPGAGMAILYITCALVMTRIGLAGFWLAELKTLDVSHTTTKEMP